MNSKFSYNLDSYSSLTPHIGVYYPDGKGRDGYIYTNNGGFMKTPSKFTKQPEFGAFNFARHYNLSIGKSPSKYFADGSGRDTYVSDYVIKNLKGDVNLPDILRSPAVNPSPKKNYYTRKEVDANKDLKLKETQLINRIFYNSPGREKRERRFKIRSDKEKYIFNLSNNLNNSGENTLTIQDQDKDFVPSLKARKKLTLLDMEDEKNLFSNHLKTKSDIMIPKSELTNLSTRLKLLNDYEGVKKR